jgi:hypothetical protein
MTKPTTLRDAEPEPWKAERRPDLSPELLALCAAHDKLKAAQAACHDHEPPYAGQDWRAKTQAYAEARDALSALFEQIRRGDG